MSKRWGAGTSKATAIRNTLERLGMQATPELVVAALARFGIDVAEALVRQVKVEMLKAAQVRRHHAKALPAERPKFQRQPKLPPRRGYRA